MKPLEIGYGDEKIVIFPKMISVAVQEDVERQLSEQAETDPLKYEKNFAIRRDALDAWSVKPAVKVVKKDGKCIHEEIKGGLKTLYAEMTIENERIVTDAFTIVLNQLRPDGRFLS